jgi:hypothetical protein
MEHNFILYSVKIHLPSEKLVLPSFRYRLWILVWEESSGANYPELKLAALEVKSHSLKMLVLRGWLDFYIHFTNAIPVGA